MRVYADTSVFGGVFDPEFEKPSGLFFKQAKHGLFDVVVSDVTVAEIEKSPDQIQCYFNELKHLCELVEISAEMIDLQRKYLEKGIVGEKSRDDALHVAAATVSRCPLIVSWNFKHIVNFRKIHSSMRSTC